MKKWMKISLGFIGGIILLFVIDLVCIFTINRPLLAFKEDNGDSVSLIDRGLIYDTYNCHEYSTPQIKAKGTKFTCAIQKNETELYDIEIIIDDTETCDTALEKFYEDEDYYYYFPCIKSKYVFVIYTNGTKENIVTALENKRIRVEDLTIFDIKFTKEEK